MSNTSEILGFLKDVFTDLWEKKVSKSIYDDNRYHATVVRWIDGDTVKLTVDLGQRISTSGNYRLARIDAPEVKMYEGVTVEEKQRGLELTEMLETTYPPGTQLIISTSKSGKYGRYIIEIWLEKEDGSEYTLSSWLIAEGLVEYKEY